MKKFVLGAALAAVTTASAMAADMAVPVQQAGAPARARCVADAFSGGYVGLNAGGAFWSANRTDLDAMIEKTTFKQETAGGVIGGQIGYNWTLCQAMIGFEVDGDWASAKNTFQLIPNTPGADQHVKSQFDAFASQRLRAGVVVDSLLLYVTAGVAEAHFKTEWVNNVPPIPPGVPIGPGTVNEWAFGFAGGFGAELSLTDRISARGEVLFADFPDRTHNSVSVPGLVPPIAGFTTSDSMWLVRLGLNVRLGSP